MKWKKKLSIMTLYIIVHISHSECNNSSQIDSWQVTPLKNYKNESTRTIPITSDDINNTTHEIQRNENDTEYYQNRREKEISVIRVERSPSEIPSSGFHMGREGVRTIDTTCPEGFNWRSGNGCEPEKNSYKQEAFDDKPILINPIQQIMLQVFKRILTPSEAYDNKEDNMGSLKSHNTGYYKGNHRKMKHYAPKRIGRHENEDYGSDTSDESYFPEGAAINPRYSSKIQDDTDSKELNDYPDEVDNARSYDSHSSQVPVSYYSRQSLGRRYRPSYLPYTRQGNPRQNDRSYGRGSYMDSHDDHIGEVDTQIDHPVAEHKPEPEPESRGNHANDAVSSYYDFLINEGSYKFWAVFQVVTALLLIYSAFAAIYYAKYTFSQMDYPDYLDDGFFFKRSGNVYATTTTTTAKPESFSFLGLSPQTFQRIMNALSSKKYS